MIYLHKNKMLTTEVVQRKAGTGSGVSAILLSLSPRPPRLLIFGEAGTQGTLAGTTGGSSRMRPRTCLHMA